MKGVFITVEGVEGTGKSTQLGYIRDFLEAAGKPVVMTREPGGTPFAESVRELLLAPRSDAVAADAELLLMFAARAAHLEERIRPALSRGNWVVCDRFTDATYAYQGGGRGLPHERIKVLEDFVQQGLHPDMTLMLDAPVDVGLARARNRPGAPDRFEREDIAFFERVRQVYHDRVAVEPQRFVVIDAAQSVDDVRVDVEAALARLLERRP
ncbi:MAG TPA: dTMP kinase [Gammaproteobacteria bacterium]